MMNQSGKSCSYKNVVRSSGSSSSCCADPNSRSARMTAARVLCESLDTGQKYSETRFWASYKVPTVPFPCCPRQIVAHDAPSLWSTAILRASTRLVLPRQQAKSRSFVWGKQRNAREHLKCCVLVIALSGLL